MVYNGEVVYIGQTKTSLQRRKWAGYRGTVISEIANECDMILIEETDDVSRERYWIEFHKDTIWNISKGDTGLTKKELKIKWISENKDKINQKQRERLENNKDEINRKRREWYANNKEKIKEREKQRRKLNKDEINRKKREWYLKKKETSK